jgi:hypothetical protein
MSDNPRFHVFMILGVALIAAVFVHVATGDRLPGIDKFAHRRRERKDRAVVATA